MSDDTDSSGVVWSNCLTGQTWTHQQHQSISVNGGISMCLDLGLDITVPLHDAVQQDLFKHFVQSQWIPTSSIPLEDDDLYDYTVQWLKTVPYLAEAWCEHNLEFDIKAGTSQADFFYVGDHMDYCAWRIRWSEYFESEKYIWM